MTRTAHQIREHYDIEKALASKLMAATKADRLSMYGHVYEELFSRLPHHPQLVQKNADLRAVDVGMQLKLLSRFFRPQGVFLEVGAGDCALSFALAVHFKEVYALDVSETITAACRVPANFRLILSDGCSIPLPPESVDVAYSNQLMEHLHPEDALEQLQNILAALKVGGTYVCVTPNRLSGPHDISRGFTERASGLHLKEYDCAELLSLFRRAGYRRIDALLGIRQIGLVFRIPASVLFYLERSFRWVVPKKRLSTMARVFPFRGIFDTLILVGVK